MNLDQERIKRKQFCDILYDLAQKPDSLKDASDRVAMYKRLEALYDATSGEKSFRHFCSDIFSVLADIKRNPNERWDLNYLGINLERMRNGYQPVNYAEDGRIIDISDSINKLYDHVNLDIARMSYLEAEDRNIMGEEALQDVKARVNIVSEKINAVRDMQKSTEITIRNQQREYIAILGIFAAVVLSFTGGISFSNSVLSNIHQVSTYRLVFIMCVIGLILVNILQGLFYYTNKIVNKEERLRPIYVSNAVVILFIIVIVLAWWFGVVEYRNHNLDISAGYSMLESGAFEEANILLLNNFASYFWTG